MFDNKPLVSVVMSCYNGEKYIRETIESILTQTYTNFEFIIWDDGSTDGSKAIIDSFKDDRIRYFYHENTGLGMALHLACEKSLGKYIARMDDDDISYLFRFEKEVEYLESHPECVLVSSAVDYIDDNGSLIGRSLPCTLDKVLRGTIKNSNMIVHPMVMFRRDAYLETGGYSALLYYEDRLLWSRLAKYGKFHNIPTPLGQYRLLRKSLSRSENHYRAILFAFIGKIVNDSEVLDSDIEAYNKLYKYSQQFVNPNEKGILKRETTISYKIYLLLKPIVGGRLSQSMIIYLTNIHHLLKFVLSNRIHGY